MNKERLFDAYGLISKYHDHLGNVIASQCATQGDLEDYAKCQKFITAYKKDNSPRKNLQSLEKSVSKLINKVEKI